MPIQIRRAQRRKAKLRLALIGPTGSGKTYSALRLAFGIGGRVGVIDTENGSADLYADLGDYDVITLEKPYTVDAYREAIAAFEDAGHDIIIIDSLSHAWQGTGGLLERQGQIEKRLGNSFSAWREITPQHHALVEAMLTSPAHIIMTLRVKTEYVIETNEKGKQAPRKVGLAPVFRDGIEYETSVTLDIDADHRASASKDRTRLFDGFYDVITERTGQKLRAWLEQGEEALPPAPKPERKMTVAEWLSGIQAAFAETQGHDAVEAIVQRDDVQKALQTLRNGAIERLKELIDAAREGAAEDAIWPPDPADAVKLLPDEHVNWPGPEPEREAA
jgi:AAA domain